MRKTIVSLLIIFLFFIGRSMEAQALEENVSITATVEDNGTTPGGGGSSGGGVVISPRTSVRFSGEAYPKATVYILKNGENITSIKADNQGLFSATMEEKYSSTTLYSLLAKDVANNRSLLINYPLVVTTGYLTYLSGIRFPPTIVVDKLQVALGDFISINGYALPEKELQIVIADEQKNPIKNFTVTSSNTGRYNITLPLINLVKGNYLMYVKYGDEMRNSKLIKFIIGDTNISSIDSTLNIPGNCNNDGVIDLVDFSILAFWYKKPNPPYCVDINLDGIVNLTDFSILAFYWTN